MFRIFIPNASQNKLCVSINFIIFGVTDQKLWMFQNFRRLGRVCAGANEEELTTCKKNGGIRKEKGEADI
jgi:hypothetical protein